ncbi:MAG: protoheme IX farnesyltransferase [Chloroflexi bacterium]|nr:MAG: protoheme IX farnesyltransferase [Chloroflexota bacterium]
MIVADPVLEQPVLAAAPASARMAGAGRLALDYLSLLKPRIGLLLVSTELGAMVVAARGWPGAGLTLAALGGGALAAGGASAINCWFDRDIDAVMARTCARPVPAGRIPPWKALAFGIAAGIIGVAILAWFTTMLAAGLALAGGLFYVLVYTMWLKRSTAQNIVIGGAAGAFPPLCGWAAVTGRLSLLALSLFAVIFFWTPPHFWSLALLLQRQYRAVRVPMLPSVAGEERTRRAIAGYAAVLLGVSLLPALWLGQLFLYGSLALGTVMLALVAGAWLDRGLNWAVRLFHYSLLYLALFFALAATVAALPVATQAVAVSVAGAPAGTGVAAPDFTSQDLDGRTVRLSALRGKPVIVTFWATWCTACQDEMPLLRQALDANRASGLTVLAADYRETDRTAMKRFLQRFGAGMRPVLDPQGRIAQAYGVRIGLPVSVFVDRAGTVVAIQVGAISRAELAADLPKLMG